MRVLYRPEAEVEMVAARDWYEARSIGLGLEFVRCVDAAIASAQRTPDSFLQLVAPFRRVLLRRFPYSLIYTIESDALVVIACYHHRRAPGIWLRREKK